MRKNKVASEKICPFTLEPVENCLIRKLVFGKEPCPFSLEGCWSERPTKFENRLPGSNTLPGGTTRDFRARSAAERQNRLSVPI